MDILKTLEDKGVKLNEQQKDAVFSLDKNTLLLAVAGSGKTTVLVSRLANLIYNNGVNATSILTLTFSRNAAIDMKKRYINLFGDENVPLFSTIHSFCNKVINRYCTVNNIEMPTILESTNASEYNKTEIIKQIAKDITETYCDDDTAESIINDISFMKNNGKDSRKSYGEIVNRIMVKYDEFKHEHNLIDFDDMLGTAFSILKKEQQMLSLFQNKYTHFFVDEAQDTSKIQHKIIKLISNNGKKSVFMVGDEDQSIYGFRGAYPQALLNFKRTYCNSQILKLEQNYRSNSDIIVQAKRIIEHNKIRYQKNMFSVTVPAEPSVEVITTPVYAQQFDFFKKKLTELKQDENVAILYRNKESALPYIDYLIKNRIKYTCKNEAHSFFKNKAISAIMNFFAFSQNRNDFIAFKRIAFYLGCYSKTLFTFIEENKDKYADIIECVMNCPFAEERILRMISTYAKMFDVLAQKDAATGIAYILNVFEFSKYIFQENTENTTLTLQKIEVLKYLSANDKTIQAFQNHMKVLKKAAVPTQNGNAKIIMSTIHASKGLEYDNVIMLDVVDGVLPSLSAVASHRAGDDSEMEEEIRLWYVAITRAKRKLYIIKPVTFGNEKALSRFTQWIEGKKMSVDSADEYIGSTVWHFMFGYGKIVDFKKRRFVVAFSCNVADFGVQAFENENIIKLVDDIE